VYQSLLEILVQIFSISSHLSCHIPDCQSWMVLVADFGGKVEVETPQRMHERFEAETFN